tara:strand:+ start:2824 stop:3255 length:432 start_codon:yes stop_codon:yes gene_type:complete
MSSLNIDQLYSTIDELNYRRLQHFDEVLKKIHNRIKYNARLEKMYCFYQVPEFIIGKPLYNIEDLRKYLINSLKKDGFQILYVDPNWLFINWELRKKKKTIINKVKKEVKNDYKLIDEYKPTGKLIYNENDLISMKDKIKHIS